jgi:hypothetical protein
MLSNGIEAPMALRPTSVAAAVPSIAANRAKFLAGMEPALGRTLCSPETTPCCSCGLSLWLNNFKVLV